MIQREREIIIKLIRKEINKEQFLQLFFKDTISCSNYIKQLLEVAFEEKEADDIDYLVYVVFALNLVTDEYINLLIKLMYAPWHYTHEDIATIFQSFKFPQTIKCLYDTALTQFEYLEFDDSFALAVKCIWALGEINTVESKEKLTLLAKSENEIIKENAINQLNRKKPIKLFNRRGCFF